MPIPECLKNNDIGMISGSVDRGRHKAESLLGLDGCPARCGYEFTCGLVAGEVTACCMFELANMLDELIDIGGGSLELMELSDLLQFQRHLSLRCFFLQVFNLGRDKSLRTSARIAPCWGLLASTSRL